MSSEKKEGSSEKISAKVQQHLLAQILRQKIHTTRERQCFQVRRHRNRGRGYNSKHALQGTKIRHIFRGRGWLSFPTQTEEEDSSYSSDFLARISREGALRNPYSSYSKVRLFRHTSRGGRTAFNVVLRCCKFSVFCC